MQSVPPHIPPSEKAVTQFEPPAGTSIQVITHLCPPPSLPVIPGLKLNHRAGRGDSFCAVRVPMGVSDFIRLHLNLLNAEKFAAIPPIQPPYPNDVKGRKKS